MSRIITLGNELLKNQSEIVTEFDKKIGEYTENMFGLLVRYNGIGLASVQIGDLIQVFVVSIPKDKPRVFINPEIIETSLEQDVYEEGCLSIPGINADVTRPSYVKIQAWNTRGRPFTLQAEGLLARVIQHEFDHLKGCLFIDRLHPDKKERLLNLYNKKNQKGK
ncbi:MAG: peptide deformylase [Spirochaetales bacterium]|nr:peptide deformylase [Spirochaetales bacterium]